MQRSKSAIALLITVMFVIVITVAIGFGLKQVNDASSVVKSENFLYQSSMIVEDILHILKTSPDVQRVIENNSSSDFYAFLAQAAFIPFEVNGLDIVMKLSSARGEFNPNALIESGKIQKERVAILKRYFNMHMVNSDYVDILLDNMSKVKVDNSYNSRIFDANPSLFRDYIASSKHLQKINDFYAQEYNDNSLKNINFKNLFYFSSDANSTIDLNYATPEVWEMMLGCDKERAEELSAGGGGYENEADLDLQPEELLNLQKFQVGYFEPIVQVEINIMQNSSDAKVRFEYNIREKKGSNFVYEI